MTSVLQRGCNSIPLKKTVASRKNAEIVLKKLIASALCGPANGFLVTLRSNRDPSGCVRSEKRERAAKASSPELQKEQRTTRSEVK